MKNVQKNTVFLRFSERSELKIEGELRILAFYPDYE